MRWVKLSQEHLGPALVEALTLLLDVPADLLDAAWQRVHDGSAYRAFQLRLDREREIHVPCEPVRELQQRILTRVLYSGPVSPAAFAGVPGRSVITAARRHFDRAAGQVVVCDVRDAYGSTTYSHVVVALRRRLGREVWALGLSNEEEAGVLGALGYFLTAPRPGGPGRRLPLGAPSSVALFNLICLELDGALLRLLSREEYEKIVPLYTRYVDDLVFSASKPFRKEFTTEVAQIVTRHDFRLNADKTRRMPLSRATIYGLQRVESRVLPGAAVRERLARQVREQLDVLADPAAAPRRQLRSRAAVRAIDGYLRQFYDAAGIERPEPLRFAVPPVETQPLQHLDLLWE